MQLLLEKEMKDLIDKNKRFMSKLIKENRYLQNEINICKDKLQKLENVDKTNKYNVDKLEKENFILKEERKMFDLKLKVSEESLSKAEERICALENEIEKLEMEIYSLMANKDCNDNEIVKDVLLSNSSEVSLCLDKIKELIINEKCDEAEELFNNNSDLIISSEGDFSEEDIITVLYLAFYNNSLEEFLKNKELSAYYNSSNEEAKIIKILKEEESLKIGESIEECYQNYINLKANIFENINPLIKKYILANNLDYSYEYYNNVTVIVNLIIRNRYKNKKCFIKIRDKYCLVNVFEKLESENKETYIIKDDYNRIRERIGQCIEDANTKYSAKTTELQKIFTIKSVDKIINIEYKKILFFETAPIIHKVIVHAIDRQIEFYAKMKDIEQRLDDRFYRCHKSFIVNRDNINEIDFTKRCIYMINGEQCLISTRLMKGLKNNRL